MVTNIKQRCQERISRANDNAISPNAKAICAVAFPEIDDAFLQFPSLARMAKFPVTQAVSANGALLTRERLLNYPDISEQRQEKLEGYLHQEDGL